MKHRYLPLLAIAFVSACSGGGADANGDGTITSQEVAKQMDTVQLTPGQWEAVNEVTNATIEGVPQEASNAMTAKLKGQTTSSKSCITPEQAKNPSADFLAMQKEVGCDYNKFSMSGGNIDAQISCSGPKMPGKMVMTMTGDYNPSSYDIAVTAVADGLPNGMKMNISSKTTGKRIGDCPTG